MSQWGQWEQLAQQPPALQRCKDQAHMQPLDSCRTCEWSCWLRTFHHIMRRRQVHLSYPMPLYVHFGKRGQGCYTNFHALIRLNTSSVVANYTYKPKKAKLLHLRSHSPLWVCHRRATLLLNSCVFVCYLDVTLCVCMCVLVCVCVCVCVCVSR